MTKTCDSSQNDLACGGAALVIWCIPMAILAATALSNAPLLVVIWPAILVWMGSACLVNARRCGRRHCYVTGPFFIVLAVVSLLYGLRILDLGPEGWRTLTGILLLGSLALTCVPEWIWGKYRSTNDSRQASEGGS